MQSLIRVGIIIIRQNTYTNKAENEEKPPALSSILFCLFVVFRSTRECFTHIKTSQLQVKAANFLGTYGH